MKKRNFLWSLMAGVALIATGFHGMKSFSPKDHDCESLMVQNIEALSEGDDEGSQIQGFEIKPYECTIEGLAQVEFMGKIIKADAKGIIRISGARDCKYGGTSMCEPVTCLDIYKIIFH